MPGRFPREGNRDSTEYWALPACNPTGDFELTFGGGRTQGIDAPGLTDTVLQAKTIFRPLEPGGAGFPGYFRAVAIALAAAVLASCGRSPAPAAEPASHEEAMKLASTKWELNRWSEVFAACDTAFRYADRTANHAVFVSADCAAEASSRLGKPELALPHYQRIFEAYEDRLATTAFGPRLANNYGVLLVQRGRRAEGIARLEWALDLYPASPYLIKGAYSYPAWAMVVKNLARAYYETASDPAVRAWVQRQGSSIHQTMGETYRGAYLSMGAADAMRALIVIGRRQANTDTPAWEARLREWEPLEEEFAAREPQRLRACDLIPLRTTMMEVCMRELAPPP